MLVKLPILLFATALLFPTASAALPSSQVLCPVGGGCIAVGEDARCSYSADCVAIGTRSADVSPISIAGGDATGGTIVAGGHDATSCRNRGDEFCAAIAGTGTAESRIVAASALGDAHASDRECCNWQGAAIAGHDARGAAAIGGHDATGGLAAASGTGTASTPGMIAASLTGSATSAFAAISLTGAANGQDIAVGLGGAECPAGNIAVGGVFCEHVVWLA